MRRFGSLIAVVYLLACGQGGTTPDPVEFPQCGESANIPLRVDPAAVEAAIGFPEASGAGHEPVLLIHGTGSTSFESWANTYVPALSAAGFSVYTLDLPGKSYGDIQDSSEYLVHALRYIHGLTGQRIDIVAHSQGGLEPRWAFRFWPDTQPLVDDLIMLGAPNHGTLIVDAYCQPGCKPAHWQMARDSVFLAALNTGEDAVAGVDITSLYSWNDELVQPQLPESTSALSAAANIAVQELCPGRVVDHVGLMRDGAVYAAVLDALIEDGPTDPARFDPLSCTDLLIPGIGPVDSLQANYYFWASGDTDVPDTDHEPPLKDYVCQTDRGQS